MRRFDVMKAEGPDFLGIGAPRCGTTWLYAMLSKHTEIWVPPLKEVHYFDSIDPSIGEPIHVDSLAFRFKKMFPNRVKHYIGYSFRHLIKEAQNKAKPDLRWDYFFFKPGSSLEWYRQLFNRTTESAAIKGEITPAYIMLSSDTIKVIKSELNVNKILLMLRSPIDATWSCIEKQARDGHLLAGHNNTEELIRRAKSPGLFKRYDYDSNLKRWFDYYNQNDVFIGFFEELAQDPVSLLSRVFSYLEVEDISDQLSKNVNKRINKSSGSLPSIPFEVKYNLALMHRDQINRLRKYVKGYPEIWYEEIQDILKSG